MGLLFWEQSIGGKNMETKKRYSMVLSDICDFGFWFGLGFFSAGLAVLGIVTGLKLIWDNLIK